MTTFTIIVHYVKITIQILVSTSGHMLEQCLYMKVYVRIMLTEFYDLKHAHYSIISHINYINCSLPFMYDYINVVLNLKFC